MKVLRNSMIVLFLVLFNCCFVAYCFGAESNGAFEYDGDVIITDDPDLGYEQDAEWSILRFGANPETEVRVHIQGGSFHGTCSDRIYISCEADDGMLLKSSEVDGVHSTTSQEASFPLDGGKHVYEVIYESGKSEASEETHNEPQPSQDTISPDTSSTEAENAPKVTVTHEKSKQDPGKQMKKAETQTTAKSGSRSKVEQVEKAPNGKGAVKVTEGDATTPETGDATSSIVVWTGIALSSAAVIALLRRKYEH